MQISDLVVEVRDASLTRQGVITPAEMDLEVVVLHNNVGEWKLSLPSEHRLAAILKQPGSGLVVNWPAGTFSGPTLEPEEAATPDDREGTVTFKGVGDSIVLHDSLAWPEPANSDVTTQSVSHDTRTGVAETLMHAYVNANIGPGASVARRNPRLVLGADGQRGETLTKSARFPTLGSLLDEIARPSGLGFRVIQQGSSVEFQTYKPLDRSREVRLTIDNGGLAGQKASITAPGVTRAIVAGGGELTDRVFVERTSDKSLQAESDWGRRIERFIDQRQTVALAELQQAGDEVLAEEGFAAIAVQAVPAQNSTLEFGRDWDLGDVVSVEIGGAEAQVVAIGATIKANKDGLKVAVLLGDEVAFSPPGESRSSNVVARVSNLEREGSPSAAAGGTDQSLNVTFATASTTWTINHNFARKYVDVITLDGSGNEIVGDIEYVNSNTVSIHFYFAQSGTARVST